MGDGADMALDFCLQEEESRFLYLTGDMDDMEAFELGIIDELGYMHTGGGSKEKVCRCCGRGGLTWGMHKERWRLFDTRGLHACPVNPLKEDV